MIGKNRKLTTSDSVGMFSAGGRDMAYHRPFMDVREFLSSLSRQKLYVIGAVVFAMTAAALYLFVAPKSYTATAQVLIDLNRPLTDEAQSVGADTTRFMMGPVIDSQVEIIRANRIARRVIEKTGYDDFADPTPRPAAGDGAQSEISLAALNRILRSILERTGYGDSADPTPGRAAGDSAHGEISLDALNRFQHQLDVRRKG